MVKIFTVAHKRPDFIKIQYESIQKHVKCPYEFVVFNNSIDSESNKQEIHNICNEIGVKCVNIELLEEFRVIQGETNFGPNGYPNANFGTSYPLIWIFNKYLTDEEKVCIIDSDMFLLGDLDIDDILKDKDIAYIPQYRDNGNVKYIWNAFVCLNMKRNPELRKLDWHPGRINNVGLDVGGQTHYSLIKNNFDSETIEEYSIYECSVDSQGRKNLHFILNGNINYRMVFDSNDTLLEFTHIGGEKLRPNKSFPHELDVDNYADYLSKRALSILKLLESKGANLPDPKHIGLIGLVKSSDFFIVHYKSGSNYLSFSTNDYNSSKTREVRKLL